MRILVADDDQIAAGVLANYFASLGHEVRIANDGESALVVAAEFRPELAILNICKPLGDEYEVARQLRASDAGSKLVLAAVTGLDREGDERRAMDAGFDYFFIKPVDRALLRALVKRAAERVDLPE